MDPEFGLILADDVTDEHSAIDIAVSTGEFFDGIKIGMATMLKNGLSVLETIKKRTEKPVIADLKVADIGFQNTANGRWEGTNSKIVKQLADAGAEYIICHGIVGPASIQECIEVAHQSGARILTLPYMTHKGAELFFGHPLDKGHVLEVLDDIGVSAPPSRIHQCRTVSDALIVLTDYFGVDGFIGPANNLPVVRRYRELTNKQIFGPGIGRQSPDGASLSEQLRRFYQAGGSSTAAIIGSAVYGSVDPVAAARQIRQWRDDITKSRLAIG